MNYEGEKNFQEKGKLKWNWRSMRWSLKAFAVFTTAMLVISAFSIAQSTFTDNVYVDQLRDQPYEATINGHDDAILTFLNIYEETNIIVTFDNVQPGLDGKHIYLDGIDIGIFGAAMINKFLITLVPAPDHDLQFEVCEGLFVKIEEAYGGNVPISTDTVVTGSTFLERGDDGLEVYSVDFLLEDLPDNQRAYFISLNTISDFTYMAIDDEVIFEYDTIINPIPGEIYPFEIILPPETDTFRILWNEKVDFDLWLNEDPSWRPKYFDHLKVGVNEFYVSDQGSGSSMAQVMVWVDNDGTDKYVSIKIPVESNEITYIISSKFNITGSDTYPPQDVKITIGYADKGDWITPGHVGGSITIDEISNEMNLYVADNADEAIQNTPIGEQAYVEVPVGITAAFEGEMTLGDLDVVAIRIPTADPATDYDYDGLCYNEEQNKGRLYSSDVDSLRYQGYYQTNIGIDFLSGGDTKDLSLTLPLHPFSNELIIDATMTFQGILWTSQNRDVELEDYEDTDGNPVASFAADFNNDGYLDAIVVNEELDEFIYFKNNGDDTFAGGVSFETGDVNDDPKGANAADFDGDGDMDVVISNYGTDTISYFTNDFIENGDYDDGRLFDKDDISGNANLNRRRIDVSLDPDPLNPTNPDDIASADFDGDGDIDIVITNHNMNSFSFLSNDGTGHFVPIEEYEIEVGVNPSSIEVSDVDNDQDEDIIVTSYSPDLTVNMVSVFGNNGNGIFPVHNNYQTFEKPIRVISSDVDTDGMNDLLVCTLNPSGSPTFHYFMNTGYERLFDNDDDDSNANLNRKNFNIDKTPTDMDVADFSGDGKPDVFFSTAAANYIFYYKNDGDDYPYNLNRITLPVGGPSQDISLEDYDSDSDPDIGVILNDGGFLNEFHYLENLDQYPTMVTLDVGNDGIIDWQYDWEFKNTMSLPDFSAAINRYIDLHTTGAEPEITIPMQVSSGSVGRLVISDILIKYRILLTDPWDWDTDDDGLKDGWHDEDNSGTYDTGEEKGERQFLTDPVDADSDDDCFEDGPESKYWTDPSHVGSIPDYDIYYLAYSDSDNEGLLDGKEVGESDTMAYDSDSDDDGITDYDEWVGYKVDSRFKKENDYTLGTYDDTTFDISKYYSSDTQDYRVNMYFYSFIIVQTQPEDGDIENILNDIFLNNIVILLNSIQQSAIETWSVRNSETCDEFGLYTIYEYRTISLVKPWLSSGTYNYRFKLLTSITDPGPGHFETLEVTLSKLNVEHEHMDPLDVNIDDDGLDDGFEAHNLINPFRVDTDGDTISDYDEVNYDSDDTQYSPKRDLNPNEPDTDGDGIDDNVEIDPTKADTDPLDRDTDNDGLPDGWIDGWTFDLNFGWHYEENLVDTVKQIYEGEDFDGDGILDDPGYLCEEEDTGKLKETNPLNGDVDGDGLPDGWEAFYHHLYGPSGTVAHAVCRFEKEMEDSNNDGILENIQDSDSDGIPDYLEYVTGTDPGDSDSDNDGLTDGEEIFGVYFRTNIDYGARYIDYYRYASWNPSGGPWWIDFRYLETWKHLNWYDWIWDYAVIRWNRYEYTEICSNDAAGSRADGRHFTNKLVRRLYDQTKIYYNSTNDEIYVWEPYADVEDGDEDLYLNGIYYRFVNIGVTPAEYQDHNPLYVNPIDPASRISYRFKELYKGPDPLNPDSDEDRINDGDEDYSTWGYEFNTNWFHDTDFDGIINVFDTDSDNDGISDGLEDRDANWDHDQDGRANMVDLDSDNDGVPDKLERAWFTDTDNDGLDNMVDFDSDGDGLWDGINDYGVDGLWDESPPYHSPIYDPDPTNDNWQDFGTDGIPSVMELDGSGNPFSCGPDDLPYTEDGDELMDPAGDDWRDSVIPNGKWDEGEGTENNTQYDLGERTQWNRHREPNEIGEDVNCNGAVDPLETDPLKWDSDGDGLSDGAELSNVLFFYEAEDYCLLPSQIVEDEGAGEKEAVKNVDFSSIGDGPTIIHQPVTSAIANRDLVLYAKVIDDDSISSVVLYHRASGTGSWPTTPITGSDEGENIYSFTIDESDIVLPGLEYYIEATDSESNINILPRTEFNNPPNFIDDCYSISIEPLTIKHTPVEGCSKDRSHIRIEAQVYDDVSVSSVLLYYKFNSEGTWPIPVSMIGPDSEEVYYYDIDPGEFDDDYIEYYIEATDSSSNVIYNPTGGQANPYQIDLFWNTLPGPINDLKAIPAGTNSVKLIWTAPGRDFDLSSQTHYGKVDKYFVRYTDTEPSVPLATWWGSCSDSEIELTNPQVAYSVEEYTITDIDLTGKHYFAIRSYVNDNSNEFWSIISIDSIPHATPAVAEPSAPTGLEIFGYENTENQIYLCWDQNSEVDFSHYIIYRGTEPDSLASLGTTTSNFYIDTSSVEDGVTYHYYITAYSSEGIESLPSFQISITPAFENRLIVVPQVNLDETLSYRFYVRARLAPDVDEGHLQLRVKDRSNTALVQYTDEKELSRSYHWYCTETFSDVRAAFLEAFDMGSEADRPTVYVDRVLLVKVYDEIEQEPDIFNLDLGYDGDAEFTVTLSTGGGEAIYITEGTMTITADTELENPTITIGNGVKYNLIWYHHGPFSAGSSETIDITMDVNKYLNGLDNPSNSNVISFMIENTPDPTGDQVDITNIQFNVKSYFADPTDTDTDDDGMPDGDEVQAKETDTFQNLYPTDPSDKDTDDDTLNDGKEIRGWDIFVENGKDGRIVHVTSNPLKEDSDDDGILDFEEINNAVRYHVEAEDISSVIDDGSIYPISDTDMVALHVGDADNDGFNDIVVTRSYGSTDVVKIYRWDGITWDGTYYPEIPVGVNPVAVFVADANNDGFNDIVTANKGDYTVTVLKWDDGTQDWLRYDSDPTPGQWVDPTSLYIQDISVGNEPVSIFVADFDNDGDNDIVTANKESGGKITILEWDGSPWDIYDKSVGNEPMSVFIGDADNEIGNEIVTANKDSHTVTILKKTSTGWGRSDPSSGTNPISVFVGDVDNDGENEIITANDNNDDKVTIIKKDETGWSSYSMDIGNGPKAVFIADVDNEADSAQNSYDIITMNYDEIIPEYTSSIYRWNGKGGVQWSDRIDLPMGDSYDGLFVADANNNDLRERTDRFTGGNNNRWFELVKRPANAKIRIDITLNDLPQDPGQYSFSVLNGVVIFETAPATDSDIKIKYNYSIDSEIVALKSDTIWISSASKHYVALGDKIDDIDIGDISDASGTLTDICIGDVDNDGDNDIVTTNSDSVASPAIYTMSILTWNGFGYSIGLPITVGDGPQSVHIGDVDNDGDNDIVTANSISNTISIVARYYNRWVTSADAEGYPDLDVGNKPVSVFVGDANNDGFNDIVTANEDSGSITIWTWDDSAKSWVRWDKSIGSGSEPSSITIGDANNDGQNEIVVACKGFSIVRVYVWDPASSDWDDHTRTVDTGPLSVFIGDANNDGFNDIMTANSLSTTVSILRWDSDLTWTLNNIDVGGAPQNAYIADIDNDDDNDIVCMKSDEICVKKWDSKATLWDSGLSISIGNLLTFDVGDGNNDWFTDIVYAVSETGYPDSVHLKSLGQVILDMDSQQSRAVVRRFGETEIEILNNAVRIDPNTYYQFVVRAKLSSTENYGKLELKVVDAVHKLNIELISQTFNTLTKEYQCFRSMPFKSTTSDISLILNDITGSQNPAIAIDQIILVKMSTLDTSDDSEDKVTKVWYNGNEDEDIILYATTTESDYNKLVNVEVPVQGNDPVMAAKASMLVDRENQETNFEFSISADPDVEYLILNHFSIRRDLDTSVIGGLDIGDTINTLEVWLDIPDEVSVAVCIAGEIIFTTTINGPETGYYTLNIPDYEITSQITDVTIVFNVPTGKWIKVGLYDNENAGSPHLGEAYMISNDHWLPLGQFSWMLKVPYLYTTTTIDVGDDGSIEWSSHEIGTDIPVTGLEHAINQYLVENPNLINADFIEVPIRIKTERPTTTNIEIHNIEMQFHTFATNPDNADTDYDGLWDGDELQLTDLDSITTDFFSYPNATDTDHDGVNDYLEVAGSTFWATIWDSAGGVVKDEQYTVITDPMDIDKDDDGLTDFVEWQRTHGDSLDSDFDNIDDNLEIRVVFRTNAINGVYYTPYDSAYNTDLWIGVNTDEMDLNLEGYKLPDPCEVSTISGNVISKTPEGWDVYYDITPNEVYIDVPDYGSTIAIKFIATTDSLDDLTQFPNAKYGIRLQETYWMWTFPHHFDTDLDDVPDGWINGYKYDELPEESKSPLNGEDLNCDGFTYGDSNHNDVWDDGDLPWEETNPRNPDSDNDYISDGNELYFDEKHEYGWLYDGDGVPDADGDGLIDPLDMDSDNDGLPDNVENWDLDRELDADLIAGSTDDDYDVFNQYDNPYFTYQDETNPYYPESDGDGLWDGWDDENANGVWDSGEPYGEVGDASNSYAGGYGTDPTDWDTDNDWLIDGHYPNMADPYSTGGENGEVTADDSLTGVFQSDPLMRDTDEDNILDGIEFYYHPNRVANPNYIVRYDDVDSDGLNSMKDTDSDNDGLPDGEENWDYDVELDTIQITGYEYYSEGDPLDYDGDDDGLYDGAEWLRWDNSDGYTGNDNFINLWDKDSNDFAAGPGLGPGSDREYDDTYQVGYDDYYETFVVFRKGTTGETEEKFTTYGDSDSWIVIDKTETNIIDPLYNLNKWTWCDTLLGTSAVLPSGANRLQSYYGPPPDQGDPQEDFYLDVNTPEGYEVWVGNDNGEKVYIVESSETIYVYNNEADLGGWREYKHQLPSKQHSGGGYDYNYVGYKQEVYDGRPMVNDDSDFDGLKNFDEDTHGTDKYDPDSDDDGVMDGLEIDWNIHTDSDGSINALDPDSDNDGILDGTEMGLTRADLRSDIILNPYQDESGGELDNFVGDTDPTTTTEMANEDTDGDGIYDGWNDDNGNGIYEPDSPENEDDGEDKNANGQFDGSLGPRNGETDPFDEDTDNDGIDDGIEDANHDGRIEGDTNNNGVWESNEDWEELSPLDIDSDDDGVADSDEREGYLNTDGDDTPFVDYNAIDQDSDNDGIEDGVELGITDATFCMGTTKIRGTDPARFDYFDTEDHDGDEDPSTTTNPILWDTDTDGIYDGWDDDNGDGIYQASERDGEDKNADGKFEYNNIIANRGGETDPYNDDTDDDGIDDGIEDADQDGRIAGDTDFDLVWDSDETWTESSPVDVDSDDDGLRDDHSFEQESHNTLPNRLYIDTDGDGVQDGTEIGIRVPISDTLEFYGTDTSRFVRDEDPFDDNTDPADYDTDDDGIWDGWHDDGVDLYENGPPNSDWAGNGQFDWDDTNSNGQPDYGEPQEQGGEDRNGNGRVDSGESDPYDTDSDDDYIPDDIEDRNLNGIYNPEGKDGIIGNIDDETSLIDMDTDGDGLLDGEEDYYKKGEVNGDETDPRKKDTDGDGLWDGDTVGTHVGEDEYGSNPLLTDTDYDGLYDGWVDADGNGEWNGEYGEWTYGTDPTTHDTDGDGLWDGWEASTYSDTVTLIEEDWEYDYKCDFDDVLYESSYIITVNAEGFGIDPVMAVYLDERVDVLLFKGTVGAALDYDFIGMMWEGSNTLLFDVISGSVTINWVQIDKQSTSPTAIDSDGDELSDNIETYGWDIFIVNTDGSDEKYHVVSDPLDEKTSPGTIGLDDFEKYQNGLFPQSKDTDYDGIEDWLEVKRLDAGENDSYPNIQESIAPEIEKITIDFITNIFGENKLTVKIKATDNTGIKRIIVIYNGIRQIAGYQGGDNYYTDFTLTWNPGGSLASYAIEVEAYDFADNAIAKEAKHEGLIEQAIEFLASALRALWDTIVDVVEAIANALASLIDWVWDMITGMLDFVFKPVVNAIEKFVTGIAQSFMEYLLDHDSSHADELLEKTTGPFYDIIKVVMDVVNAVVRLVNMFLEVIANAVDQAIDFIIGIFSGVFGASGESDYPETFSGFGLGGIGTWLTNNIVVESDATLTLYGSEVLLNSFIMTADIVTLGIAYVGMFAAFAGIVGAVGELFALIASIVALSLDIGGAGFVNWIVQKLGFSVISDEWANFIATTIAFIFTTISMILTIISPIDGSIIDGILLGWNGICFALTSIAWIYSSTKI